MKGQFSLFLSSELSRLQDIIIATCEKSLKEERKNYLSDIVQQPHHNCNISESHFLLLSSV